jgi:hypothetical protein
MAGIDKVGERKAAYVCASFSDAAVRNGNAFRHSDLLRLFGLMMHAETCSHRSRSFPAHSNNFLVFQRVIYTLTYTCSFII